MANPIFKKTIQTYQSPEGAAAYKTKEEKYRKLRQDGIYAIVEDINFKGLRVLDVGCGFGRDVLAFRKQGAKAYGMDVSNALLEYVTQYEGWFVQEDLLSKNPLPLGTFDLVWSCSVLVHVPREELFVVLQKMWRAVNPNGWLVVMTKKGCGERIANNLGEGLERIMVFYTKEEIREVMKSFGAIEDKFDETDYCLITGDERLALRFKKKESI